jgi:hypothetical protein
MRLKNWSVSILLLIAHSDGALGGGPVIDRFEAVPDCVLADPRRGILTYSVSGGILRVRIDAVHRGGRMRTFYSQSSGRSPIPSMGASGVRDPGAAPDVEAYVLVATGEGGWEITRRLDFRYRRAAFDLLPPVSHIRDTRGGDHFARYESRARVANVDSVSCSFRFDTPIAGEAGRAGTADIFAAGPGDPLVRCGIAWHSVQKARASGTVEWTARVTDRCTQGRITRAARVNSIP